MAGEEARRTRPMAPEDEAAAGGLFGDERSVRGARRRAHVAPGERGALAGAAVWLEPLGGAEGALALVQTDAAAPSRRVFYELALSCAREALTRGVLRGRFVVHDRKLLRLLERDFTIAPDARGWDERGKAVEWDVHVDVADAVRQLERRLARPNDA